MGDELPEGDHRVAVSTWRARASDARVRDAGVLRGLRRPLVDAQAPHPDGAIFWWYLVLGCSARFVIEFYRINPAVALGLSTAQWFSLLLVAIGAWRLWATRGTSPAHLESLPEPARR